MVGTAISTERQVGDIHQDVAGIGAGVANLQYDAALGKLHHASTASIDSQDHAGCLEGTRVDVLAELRNWANDRNSPPVFWLDGMAGTGKTSLAVTFCRELQSRGMLGASFFCLRQNDERGDVRRIIPTLAYGLAYSRPRYREALLRVISQIPDPGTLSIKQQWVKLLVEPFSSLPSSSEAPILSADALDECGDSRATEEMLEAARESAPSLPLKFFFTSRPEAHIRYQFTRPDFTGRSIFHLHEVQEDVVHRDILLYLQRMLVKERERWGLSSEWPPKSQVETLAVHSGQFFIYAFTACEYIRNFKMGPRRCLERLTDTDTSVSLGPLVQPIDGLYSLVLKEVFSSPYIEENDKQDLRRILAVIVSARQQLSCMNIASLLEMEPDTTWVAFQSLRSVVRIPDGMDGPISVFHASFPDYLSSRERCHGGLWCISPDEAHTVLAQQCIHILDKGLKFNISGCRSSYLANNKQEYMAGPIGQCLTYASMYWVDHLLGSSDQAAHMHNVKSLLYSKFLFWLEVLSVQNCLNIALPTLLKLLRICDKTDSVGSTELQEFIWDANGFVNSFWDAMSLSAPHIYLSALTFLHKESRVSKQAASKLSRIQTIGNVYSKKMQCLTAMHDHMDPVTSVAFSPDGQQLVSGSWDHTLRLWDARTGKAIGRPLEGHTRMVTSVAFSPDGQQLVSGSFDHTLRLWDVRTGEAIGQSLEGHTGPVSSVAFSPDGQQLVSGSDDRTLRLWDARTGKAIGRPLEGHTDTVTSVAFSPDGQQLVSGSDDCTLRLWDARTGKAIGRPIEGHTMWVTSVAFSPDGQQLVSGSDDRTLRLWDARTGKAIGRPIEGYTRPVTSVAFSPDGQQLVSGSFDRTLRLWDARTGEAIGRPFEGHTDWVTSVAFSLYGQQLVSGSDDCTLRLWNARTGEAIGRPFEGHTDSVTSVAFSPDGQQLVSGSDDCTLRLWNARTGEAIGRSLEGHHTVDTTAYLNRPSGPSDWTITGPIHWQMIGPNGLTGWLVNDSDELLFWVPPEFRKCLVTTRTIHVFGAPRVEIDFTNFHHGEAWTRCYHGDM